MNPPPPVNPAQPGEEVIPPLDSVVPSIFVPLTGDITKTSVPRDRVDRLKKILETIDLQREGVRQNLVRMFEREKQRLVRERQAEEEAKGIDKVPKPGIPPNEVDAMIFNMMQPPVPGTNYNVVDINAEPIPPQRADTPRDLFITALMNTVEMAVRNLDGYDNAMKTLKDQYLDRLAREVQRIEDAGKRPEDRVGAGSSRMEF